VPGERGGIGRGRIALLAPLGEIGEVGEPDDVLAPTGLVGEVGTDHGWESVRENVGRRGEDNRRGSTNGNGGFGIEGTTPSGGNASANVALVAESGGIPNVTRRLMRWDTDADRRDLREPPLLLLPLAACAECSEYELDDVDLRLARRFLPGGGGGNIGTTTVADAETACCDAPAPEPGAGVGVRETLKSVSSNSRGETGRSSNFGVRSGADDADADVDADPDDSTNSACGFRTGLGREGGCASGVGTSGGEGSRG